LTAPWSWLEATPVAAGIRQSLWLYPALESVHLLAMATVVGSAVVLDVRLLGRGTELPLPPLLAHVVRLVWVGLGFSVLSGLLLFAAHATEQAAKPLLWVKLSLLVVAGVNAWVFRRSARRRLAASVSLVAWAGVVVCGRLLAYV
jgi:hypothetical protein